MSETSDTSEAESHQFLARLKVDIKSGNTSPRELYDMTDTYAIQTEHKFPSISMFVNSTNYQHHNIDLVEEKYRLPVSDKFVLVRMDKYDLANTNFYARYQDEDGNKVPVQHYFPVPVSLLEGFLKKHSEYDPQVYQPEDLATKKLYAFRFDAADEIAHTGRLTENNKYKDVEEFDPSRHMAAAVAVWHTEVAQSWARDFIDEDEVSIWILAPYQVMASDQPISSYSIVDKRVK